MSQIFSLLRSLSFGAALLCPGLSSPSMSGEQTEFTPAVQLSGSAGTGRADGSLSPAARYAFDNGYLPKNPAAALSRWRPADAQPAPGLTGPVAESTIRASLITLKRAGLEAQNVTPPNISLAVGLDSYIQAVNSEVAIYNKSTGASVVTGSLNTLAATPALATSFQPRVLWDPTTGRYYYAINSAFSATNNKISVGFSKTSSPKNLTTDWCHYQISFDSRFPDFPQLGDAGGFLIIGVNSYDGSANGGFLGADLVFVDKPKAAGTITKCPKSIATGTQTNLLDSAGEQVFAPVPANQVDTISEGYVVARNGSLPSTKVWIYQVKRTATGWAVTHRDLQSYNGPTTYEYDVPPSAKQPLIEQTIDTLDARITQAIMAYSPLAKRNIMWTVQTVKWAYDNSAVNIMAIDPQIISLDKATPRLLMLQSMYDWKFSIFNGAITTDRRVDGAQKLYGDAVAVTANIAGSYYNLTKSPGVIYKSTRITSADTKSILVDDYGAIEKLDVTPGIGPYRDSACPVSGDVCPWGTTAAAAPDPRPYNRTTGLMWFANQYSGVSDPSTDTINWRTQIFAVAP